MVLFFMSRLFISNAMVKYYFVHINLNVTVSIDALPFSICSFKHAPGNTFSYFHHEGIHEIEVMIGVVYERRYLPRPEQVPQVCPGKVAAYVTAALFIERGEIKFVSRSFYVYPAGRGEERAVAGNAGWHHRIEHIGAVFYGIEYFDRATDPHHVPVAVSGEDGQGE